MDRCCLKLGGPAQCSVRICRRTERAIAEIVGNRNLPTDELALQSVAGEAPSQGMRSSFPSSDQFTKWVMRPRLSRSGLKKNVGVGANELRVAVYWRTIPKLVVVGLVRSSQLDI